MFMDSYLVHYLSYIYFGISVQALGSHLAWRLPIEEVLTLIAHAHNFS